MASEVSHTHTHGNMVAQPVDSTTAAAASEAMPLGSSQAKDTVSDQSIEFDLSEDSPTKPETRDLSSKKYSTPRSSPSPTRSKSRVARSTSRSLPVKRSSSHPVSIPMLPRRGRVAISNSELWGVEGRMVHRKVEYEEAVGRNDAAVLPLIAEQFAADRAASAQLYAAVQALAKAVNSHDSDLKDHDRRLDEITRMRFDDNKLQQGSLLHIRTGLEELETKATAQDKYVYDLLTEKMDDMVPRLVEEKIISVKAALDELKATEVIMKDYLSELSTQRPEEGKVVFAQFQAVREELAAVKAATAGLSSATAAGLNGLASAGAAPGLSSGQISLLDTMKSQIDTLVATEQVRPCHCPDVDAHAARIAYLEVTVAAMAASASGAAVCTATAAFNAATSSEDGLPPFVKKVAGGNGVCHCIHVEQLLIRVQALELGRGTAREPLMPHLRQSPPGMPRRDATRDPPHETVDINAPMNLSLPLGHLGGERKDAKSIYDDKMTQQSDYRYDGGKNGGTWKSKVERYFITKIPVALELLKWAEAHNLERVTEARFAEAAHPYLTEEQCQTFNREIWGFLSGCLSGQAEVHFKRAGMLNGLDAWRRVVRIIEDTVPMKFEQLRRAVQMIHLKSIKSLEDIPNGIAEFETTLEEYENAGGIGYEDDQVRKSDLLAILPAKLQSDLLWNSTDPKESYQRFRDTILTQSARIVDLNRRQGRGGAHAVMGSEEPMPPLGTSAAEDQREDDAEDFNPISSVEELLAMVNRQRAAGQGRQQPYQQRRQRPQQAGAAARPPRKCANCGQEHEARICPHPAVAKEDRKCWTCGKSGHASRDCPDKKNRSAVKAIEERLPFFGAVTDSSDGFRAPKKTARPTPSHITLKDFMKTSTFNRFKGIERPDPKESSSSPSKTSRDRSQPATITTRSQPATITTAGSQPARSQPDKITKQSQAAIRTAGKLKVQDAKNVGPIEVAVRSLQPSVSEQRRARAERADTQAFGNHVASLGERNTPRVGRLASVSDAWQRRSRATEQTEQCQVDALEAAVLAAVGEYTKNSNDGSIILGGCMEAPINPASSAAEDNFENINLLYDDEDEEEQPGAAMEVAAEDRKPQTVRIGVALDSGATDNVIDPDDLPKGVELTGPIGKPFSNASGGDIQKYGKCITLLQNQDTKVGCGWTACAVSRPLQSVSKIAGPEDGPGAQDIMFNNKIGVVMPPGLVAMILKHVKPVAQYPRRGGLYVADFEMSSFQRQGANR